MNNRNLRSVVRNLVSQKKLSFLVLVFCIFPFFASADVVGDKQRFSIDSSYDANVRGSVDATLRVTNPKAYFYVDDEWWNSQDKEQRQQAQDALIVLGEEFEKKIYPALTSTFGFEWKPGIDKQEPITILLHIMKDDTGGYTEYEDEYSKLQNPKSNEREMVYLNANMVKSPLLKSFLAHEFTHVITFYQKEKLHQVEEEVWLNEARAEYAPTLLGYDLASESSNLQRRVRSFTDNTFNSLTEWDNKRSDYGIANLFAQYLVDQYGLHILVDSLQSSQVGIPSLNEALAKSGISEDFAAVFHNWTIAIFLNDCSYGPRYCYYNPQLVNFRVVPSTHFLPSLGDSTVTLHNTMKDWAGNWYKIVGGKDVLNVMFQGQEGISFFVPYIVEDSQRSFSLHILQLSQANTGTILVPGFNSESRSLTILPSVSQKTVSLDGEHPTYEFSFEISTTQHILQAEQQLLQELTLQIDVLKKEIAKLQTPLRAPLTTALQNRQECQAFSQDLFFGMRDSLEVLCLQEFLKNQGTDIYPEGFVTGNFFTLTQAAVIRFQEKYAADVLIPAGLHRGTGYVGSLTRAKINSFQ